MLACLGLRGAPPVAPGQVRIAVRAAGANPGGTSSFCGLSPVRGRRRSQPDVDHRRRRVVDKGKQITGAAREELMREMKKQYENGLSIRAVAEAHGRSYGFVHQVLTEAGVPLRSRGGDRSHRRLEKAGRSQR
nr:MULTISPECIES: helix-turn-helix domain-containing protein [Streptomyces]